jgi:hypothetical protein
MALWKGVPELYVRNCLTVRTAETRSSGPLSQPTFHPVKEKVFPADEMVTVRPAAPGRVATGMWRTPNVRCS